MNSFCFFYTQVTKFQISWDPNVAEVMPQLPEGELTEERSEAAARALMAMQ